MPLLDDLVQIDKRVLQNLGHGHFLERHLRPAPAIVAQCVDQSAHPPRCVFNAGAQPGAVLHIACRERLPKQRGEACDRAERGFQVMGEHAVEICQGILLLDDLALHSCLLDRVFDDTLHRCPRDARFGNIVRRAGHHGLGGDHLIALAGHHNDGHIGKPLAKHHQYSQAVGIAEPVVEYGAIECLPLASVQRLAQIRRLFEYARAFVALQRTADKLAVIHAVVGDQNAARSARHGQSSF